MRLSWICDFYQTKSCKRDPRCTRLHLCQAFLQGHCQGDAICGLNHTLSDTDRDLLSCQGVDVENPRVYKFIAEFCRDQQKVLKYSPVMNVPRPCRDYNSKGCHDKNCRYPHICFTFVDESRHFGNSRGHGKCEKYHILLPQEKAKLAPYCFDVHSSIALKLYLEIMERFIKPGAAENFARSQQVKVPSKPLVASPVDPYECFEICYAFLMKKCAYGNSCFKVHPEYDTKFLWMYKPRGENQWKQFDEEENEALEDRFRDPEIDRGTYNGSQMKIMFDFETMKASFYPNLGFSEKILSQIMRAESCKDRVSWTFHWFNKTSGFWQQYERSGDAGISCEELDKTFEKMMPGDRLDQIFVAKNKQKRMVRINKLSNVSAYIVECDLDGNILKQVKRRPFLKKQVKQSEEAKPKKGGKAKSVRSVVLGEKPESQSHEPCTNHEDKPCTNEECPMYQYEDKDYLWLIKSKDKDRWMRIPEAQGETLEKKYCDPKVEQASFELDKKTITVQFSAEKIQVVSNENVEILRLNYGGVAKWAWYWQEADEATVIPCPDGFATILKGKSATFLGVSEASWKKIGEEGSSGEVADISSEFVEYKFQNYRSKIVTFNAGRYIYELNLKNFEQKNVQSGRVREVRRRPKGFHVSQKESLDFKDFKDPVPKDWVSKKGVTTIIIDPEDSEDCEIITNHLQSKLGDVKIRVTRIENHNLWKKYQAKKQELCEEIGHMGLNEVVLLHGCSSESIREIAESNNYPDQSENCLSYGPSWGIMFTSEVETAQKMSTRDANAKFQLFVSLVMLGDFTKAPTKGFTKTPDNPIRGVPYNSCVDQLNEATKVVVFDKDQICPLYLVKVKSED